MGGGGQPLRVACKDLQGAAMFCQQAKPRAGVAKTLSDGEELFVTKLPPTPTGNEKIPTLGIFSARTTGRCWNY